MLVLSRKSGERLLIGGGIQVVVLGVSGDNVRLGINAPREVPVFRSEVLTRGEAGNAPGLLSELTLSLPQLIAKGQQEPVPA